MGQLTVTLVRGPDLKQYGPEETKVLGTYLSVLFTHDLLIVKKLVGETPSVVTEAGFYDDEIGGWRIFDGVIKQGTVWSDILIQGAEE